jgi:hypothetical protein
MVFPFLIAGALALLTGFVVVKASKKINDIRHNVKDFLKTAANTATDVRHDTFGIITRFALTIDHIACKLTENIDTFTRGCLDSITILSRRIDVSVHLLTNVVLGFFTACSLSLLLYLTDFSPFLRTIVWFLFISLCFHMVRNYVIHSNLVELPQQYAPSIHSALDKKKKIKGEKNTNDLFVFENKITIYNVRYLRVNSKKKLYQ